MKRSKKTMPATTPACREVVVHELPEVGNWQVNFMADLFGQVLDLETIVAANDNNHTASEYSP